MLNVTTIEAADRVPETVSLRDFIRPLDRHRRLLIATFLGMFVVTLAFLLTRPKMYESHLEVLVNRERVDPMVSAEATSATGVARPPVTEEEINSEAELMHSQDLLTQIVKDNRLQEDTRTGGLHLRSLLPHTANSEAVRMDQAVTRLAADLKVKSLPKSNIIDVSYDSPRPNQTFGVLESLSTHYIDKHIAAHRPPGAFDFFSQEADRYRTGLENAETKLRTFGDGGRLAAPDLQRTALATQLASAIGQAHIDEQQIAAENHRIESDQQHLRKTDGRIRTARTVAPPTLLIQQLGGEVLKANMKRSELALKYKADYPLVLEADEELKTATTAYAQAQQAQYVSETTDNDPTHELLRQDVARAQSDLASHVGSLAATKTSIESMRSEMQDLDTAVLQQADLLRDAKANEQNYLLYVSKREQERASDTLDRIHIGNVSIAVPPSIPAVPVPSRFPAPLVAFALALFSSLALTYLVAYMDPVLHDADEVAELLKVPVVLTMPSKPHTQVA